MAKFLYIYSIVLHVYIYKKKLPYNMRRIGDEGGLDGGDTFKEEKSTIFCGGKGRTKCGGRVEDTRE